MSLTLPIQFVERTQSLLKEEWSAFEEALQNPSPISVRLNNKLTPILPFDQVAWCESGYYLPKRIVFTLDPLFHAGAYYVQEASSQFLGQIIKQRITQPVIALDLCAAPGGKSTHLSNCLHPDSFLISNEIIHSRANVLVENMQKWGNPNVSVTNRQPADFQKTPSLFDLIVIDAPCSGEGMFRKDPSSIKEWSIANVAQCTIRQRNIVSDIWDALKEDGWLIYSTCTYNRSENEENVRWIIDELGAEKIDIAIDETWGITPSEGGYRFFPHITRGEGFFITLLRKTSKSPKAIRINRFSNELNLVKDDRTKYLKPDQPWKIAKQGDLLFSFHEQHQEMISQLFHAFHPLFIGTCIGEIKGKDFVLHAALALSKVINRAETQELEVTIKDAIRFLQRESLPPINGDKGYMLVTYQHLPLGWIKNLGTRSNNLYPSSWHIRMKTDATTNYESLMMFDAPSQEIR
jgi:16S rRNA C967 or C1407 C5-methylase (RsmB/RsmF family)/NOL1/NOP2/fmu family ribosome biogenesis protein